MANFEIGYKIVMVNEGGNGNDPDDLGGETYKGIARKKCPKWAGWRLVDLAKKVSPSGPALENHLHSNIELQELVHSFYKAEFWDVLNLDYVKDQKIANELFDTGVNMGIGIAALFLQKSLNVLNRKGSDYPDLKEDAKAGTVTVGYLNSHKSPGNVLKVLNCLQGSRYVDICRANPKMEKYMNGWLTRVVLY